MKTANVSEAKNNLSALLRRVKRGETVTIYERKHAIALLGPTGSTDSGRDAWVEERVRAGVLSPGRPLNKAALKKTPWPEWGRNAPSLVDCVLANRDEDR